MKIGLNGERLLIENPAGAEKYSHNLFSALSTVDKDNKYILYFRSKPSDEYWKSLSNDNPNFSYKVIKKTLSWMQVDLAWELIKNPVHIFFTAVHTMPVFRNPKTKFIGMIHGLEQSYIHGYNNSIKRFFIIGPVEYTAKHSNHVIVPSQATKDAILNKGWVKENKLTIINEGVGKNFYKRSEKEILDVRNKFNLGNDDYLLFVSTIQPRKNIPNMINAFSQVTKLYPNLKLAIAGKKGWDYEESLNASTKYDVEDKVMFLGRVSDEDSPILFSGAKAHINVSFEEGFGLPLLEATACEVSSIVSGIPAFKEVGGDSPIYVDPKSVESIRDGIVRLISGEYDIERIKKAKERSQEFTWEKTALKTLGVFQDIIKNI
jgi:glycosyltransferase involved in cell wall biosynthesis